MKKINRIQENPEVVIVLTDCVDASLFTGKLVKHISSIRLFGEGEKESFVKACWGDNFIPLLEITATEVSDIKQQFGANCLTIFIQPPSKEVLVNRLKNRGSEDAKSLKMRIQRSEDELTYASKFDKSVVNADFDTAYMRVKNHILAFLKPQTLHVH